jgi:hypothetical protein
LASILASVGRQYPVISKRARDQHVKRIEDRDMV